MNDTSAGTAGKKTLAVFAVVERDRRSHWIRIGAAFANRDGSINLFLDAFPIGTNRLQVREPRYDDGPRSSASAPANGSAARAPAAEDAEVQP
jgi:hypothetical protein